MPTNPSRLTRASYLQLWLAVAGTPIPAGLSAPPAPFFDVGLTDREATKFNTKPEFASVEAHQADYPVMQYRVKAEGTLEVDLYEWSADNFRALYGGGTVSEITGLPQGSPKLYRFAPPRLSEGPLELVGLLDVVDGAKKHRIVIPRSTQLEGAELALKRSPNTALPLRLSILGGAEGTDPWYTITNDPAFAPVVV